MAVPKRRTSTTRKLKRRTHQKLTMPNLAECPNCGEMKRSHHICPSCGFYSEREMVESK